MPFGFLIESALANVFDYVTRSIGHLKHAQTLHEDIEAAVRKRRPEAARRAVQRLLSDTDEIVESGPPRPMRRKKPAAAGSTQARAHAARS